MNVREQFAIKQDEESDTDSYGSKTVVRYHSNQTATYSNFHLKKMPEKNGSPPRFEGSATVNLTYSETNYRHETMSGYDSLRDLKASGSTTLPGKVSLTLAKRSAGATQCGITASTDRHWKVMEGGREWSKSSPPQNGDFDNHVDQELDLYSHSAAALFQCDPKAGAYSGEKGNNELGDPDRTTITWSVRRK